MDQLNLFGSEVKFEVKEESKPEVKIDVKKEEKKAPTSTAAKGGKTATPVPKNDKVIKGIREDWRIYYYGNHFMVTEFITDFPEEGISSEQLREEMEKEFLEMSKDRTFWDVDEENKLLFPKITGGAKG
jgi:hypothetical protein